MNSKLTIIVFVLVAFGLLGCKTRPRVHYAEFEDGGLLASEDALPIQPELLAKFDGLFEPVESAAPFGFPVVLHGTRFNVSLFGDVDAIYAIMEAGCLGDRMILEGSSRAPQSTATGLVRLEVLPVELAKAICEGRDFDLESFHDVRLVGRSGPDSSLENPAEFKYLHRILDTERFQVIAHRGGCRTIDECRFSENSVENILHAEAVGATSVEIDIAVTADDVPILYHDTAFTSRLVQGRHCVGEVADFTYPEILALCRLQFGEEVPTLEAALEAALFDTDLQGVWLDTKTEDVVPLAIDAALKYNELGRQEGRGFVVGVGIPTDEVFDAFVKERTERLKADPNLEIPCLVELDSDQVQEAGCGVWAPRFTLGPQTSQVEELLEADVGTFYWTVNRQEDIDMMLTKAPGARGILSDRPHLVVQRLQKALLEGSR